MHAIVNLQNNADVTQQLKRHGYDICKVAWEDTSRFKNSAFGSNITDMTLKTKDGKMMPMIRVPNFKDTSIDVSLGYFNSPTCELKNFLKEKNLLADRDVHVLTQAQVCVLPLANDSVEFAVNMYNYQANEEHPAVLSIMITADACSAQVLNKKPMDLFVNNDGKSAWMKATRLEDKKDEKTLSLNFDNLTEYEKQRNLITIVQVPLKTPPKRRSMEYDAYEVCLSASLGVPKAYITRSVESSSSRGMDFAYLEKGSDNGEYPTLPDKLVRDFDAPIRATLQYYVVSDDVPTAANIDEIVRKLESTKKLAVASGSLVVDKNDRLTKSD